MFGFGSKQRIICCLKDIASCVSALGYKVSNLPDKEIFGVSLERIKIKKNSSEPIICYGNGAITLLECIPLKREPTPMEMLEWNYKTHLIAFSYSPEGSMAILKTHIPCSHGVTNINLELFLDIWDKRAKIFKEHMRDCIAN